MSSSTLKTTVVCWLLLAGCSDEPTGPIAPTDVVGRYELVSIGGQSLPVAWPIGEPPRVLIIADTLWLRPDSAFEQHQYREVIGPAPLYLIGRFSIFGEQLTLTVTDRVDAPSPPGPSSGKIPPAAQVRLLVGSGTSQFLYLRRCAGTSC
jgi:hypothetical protein